MKLRYYTNIPQGLSSYDVHSRSFGIPVTRNTRYDTRLSNIDDDFISSPIPLRYAGKYWDRSDVLSITAFVKLHRKSIRTLTKAAQICVGYHELTYNDVFSNIISDELREMIAKGIIQNKAKERKGNKSWLLTILEALLRRK